MVQRIQKILAAAGYGSRRACEELVEDGYVEIDGRIVSELPILVDPAKSKITVNGKPVRAEKYVYFLLNKPKGYYCTNADPEGRRRAVDLMTGVRERVFPVGRLDADSMGLLIMTNDGELSQKLTHPKYGAPKTYRVEVKGKPTNEQLASLRKGIWMAEGKTRPAEVETIHSSREKTVLEITLREGRNREIRRMLAKSGHNVKRLTRIKIGRLSVKKVPLGGYRALTASEVEYLYKLADAANSESAQRKKAKKKRSKAGATPASDASATSTRQSKRPGKKAASKKATTRGGPSKPGVGGGAGRGANQRSDQAANLPQEHETALPPGGGGRKKRRIIMPKD